MKMELTSPKGAVLGGLPLVLLLIWGCDMSVNEPAPYDDEPVQTLSVAEDQRAAELLVLSGELISVILARTQGLDDKSNSQDAEQLQKELMVSHYFDSAMSSFLSQESGGLQTHETLAGVQLHNSIVVDYRKGLFMPAHLAKAKE